MANTLPRLRRPREFRYEHAPKDALSVSNCLPRSRARGSAIIGRFGGFLWRCFLASQYGEPATRSDVHTPDRDNKAPATTSSTRSARIPSSAPQSLLALTRSKYAAGVEARRGRLRQAIWVRLRHRGGNTTTRYALSEALREDTLYYRCECKGVFPRLRHAVISTFTARRGVDGHRVFSLP